MIFNLLYLGLYLHYNYVDFVRGLELIKFQIIPLEEFVKYLKVKNKKFSVQSKTSCEVKIDDFWI